MKNIGKARRKYRKNPQIELEVSFANDPQHVQETTGGDMLKLPSRPLVRHQAVESSSVDMASLSKQHQDSTAHLGCTAGSHPAPLTQLLMQPLHDTQLSEEEEGNEVAESSAMILGIERVWTGRMDPL